MNTQYGIINEELEFFNNGKKNEILPNKIEYAKLHGSISNSIILPTWSKNVSESLKSTWELAYRILKSANEIRIIGYSLPISDNYVKYLFLNAFKDAKNLKRIDVITIDNDGEIEKRYKNFFILPNFKFKNANFLEFLLSLYPLPTPHSIPGSSKTTIDFAPVTFETAYRDFMS